MLFPYLSLTDFYKLYTSFKKETLLHQICFFSISASLGIIFLLIRIYLPAAENTVFNALKPICETTETAKQQTD